MVGTSKTYLQGLIRIYHGGATVRERARADAQDLVPATDHGLIYGLVLGQNSRGNANNGPAGLEVYTAHFSICGTTRTPREQGARTLRFPVGRTDFSYLVVENNLIHEPSRSGSSQVGNETVPIGAIISGSLRGTKAKVHAPCTRR